MTGLVLPDWLPGMVSVDPWSEATADTLYAIFRRDFVDSRPMYCGQVVWFFPEREREKERIFWHLIEHEEPPGSGKRVADFRRAERLSWVRAVIEHCNDPVVTAWDYEEGDGSIHTYLWLQQIDYVVILKRYASGGYRLLTAFWVAYTRKRRNLHSRYAKRLR